MQPAIENIIFDLDGTLLDNYQRHQSVFNRIALQIPELNQLEFETAWNQKRLGKSWSVVLDKYLKPPLVKAFVSHWTDMIEDSQALQHDILFPDIKSLLENSSDLNLFLFTARRNEEHLLKQLKEKQILHLFKEIHATRGKAKTNSLSPFKNMPLEKTLLIGDTEDDWEAATTLGVPFFAITYGLRNDTFWMEKNVRNRVHIPADLLRFKKDFYV